LDIKYTESYSMRVPRVAPVPLRLIEFAVLQL
jgi:hypothetical protein